MNEFTLNEAIRISDTLKPIVKNYIYGINHSEKIHDDMKLSYNNLMRKGDINRNDKFPEMGFKESTVNTDEIKINVYNGNQAIAESVIPVDVLAYQLANNKKVKAIKEIKSVQYDNNGNIYFKFKCSLNENQYIVNEAYIGKTQNLIAMEDCFRKLKQISRSDWDRFDTLDVVEDINALFEAQFGMEIFSLHLEPDPFPNAWTMPVGYKFDYVLDQSIKKNGIFATQRDGFKFKPNNGIAVVATITSGLLFNQEITAEETVGVLLHELGHNFADYIDPIIKAYDTKYILNIYDEIMYYAAEHALDKSDYNTNMSNWHDYENSISPRSEKARKKEMTEKEKENKRRYNTYAIRRILQIFSMNIPNALINLLTISLLKLSKTKKGKEFVARTNEMIADKFATTYGYGPAVQTGLTKISLNTTPIDEKINNIPLVGALLKINSIPGEYLVNIYDEHPNMIARIDDQIYTLEQELKKKNMSKDIRSAIEKDLAQLKKLKADITSSGRTMTESVQSKWYQYLDESLDKDEMAKISQRLTDEMDAYIKKI